MSLDMVLQTKGLWGQLLVFAPGSPGSSFEKPRHSHRAAQHLGSRHRARHWTSLDLRRPGE